METYKRTPLQLFHQPQHFLVPLFQRNYVWTEEDQWAPLWKDIRRSAEIRIDTPGVEHQHFLGAVVLQSQQVRSSSVPSWNIIDGQQRLTTLQVLMDASAAVLEALGEARAARRVERLTHNAADYVDDDKSRLKVRHLNRDRAAFDEVMEAEVPIDYADLEHASHQLAKAHRYFVEAVAEWLGEPGDDAFDDRADALTAVLEGGLQLVSIELTAEEDSQEIFETLNARGTPLTAADLVRNFVFQRLEAEGSDTVRAYDRDWPFESKFWSKPVSVGRVSMSRSSLFLTQWLTARLGEEVSPQATFSRFKSYFDLRAGMSMEDLLGLLKQQAHDYEAWTLAAERAGGNLTSVEMAVYRMSASGVELLKPVLIWLHKPERPRPPEVVDRVVNIFESWVYRRRLLKLPGSDLGRVVADVIRAHIGAADDELAARVEGHLRRLNVRSTYWPGDQELRSELTLAKMYNRFSRAQLRIFLEGIENYFRAETKQPQVERAGYPIEHILPQKWQENWPVHGPDAEEERQEHVHRLGNLTLLTTSLNSKLSNAPWPEKRHALLEHNTLKITGRLLEDGISPWDEASIDRRTSVLTNALLELWPVPEGHDGVVAERFATDTSGVEVHHLVDGGLLEVGDILHGRDGVSEAVIGQDKRIWIGERGFTPSGAAKHVRGGKVMNGWWWWSVGDGRRLMDLRNEFVAARGR